MTEISSAPMTKKIHASETKPLVFRKVFCSTFLMRGSRSGGRSISRSDDSPGSSRFRTTPARP
ncbi:MAG: hypothetical protein A6D92_09680 [Symbiobacterium thermophilum]|uniref:Uncharacterized protein n=1 Tax=Symbiobacterium thermophilum TaxID=2734 RepID=A0A1Y2T7F8_SYMTR|nr:MAG: hypothetical protein A6D92_09680 [Symbiobacterium thermophilum]